MAERIIRKMHRIEDAAIRGKLNTEKKLITAHKKYHKLTEELKKAKRK